MSVKFTMTCGGCSQSFLVDVEIPEDTQGELSLNFKDQLRADCPTCGREVILESGAYKIQGGQAVKVDPEE